MGLNTLATRSAGDTILASFFNDFNTALNTDFVGRNSSGVPTASQNLGTIAIPWGTVRADTLILSGSVVDTSQIVSPVNRLISGKTRSTSNQPAFITPNGAALSLVIDATPTPLNFDVNGTGVSVTSDITISGLTAAPGAANTALVNDTEAADQEDTRLWGEPEHRKSITIDTAGAQITGLVGKFAAFKIVGTGTEYFTAFVKSATELTHARRGYFYNSTLDPINRTKFSNNDTITLMKWGFIFVEDDATTTDVTYNVPTWSAEQPSGPATGDYWYDMANMVWKRYDGASFQIINRTLIGSFINDTSACVGARADDFYAQYRPDNAVAIELATTEIARAKKLGSKVSVAGQFIDFKGTLPTWNITTDFAPAADLYNGTEQSSTMYYLYIKDDGTTVISDISPYFREDLYGEYHPHNPWRCVGLAYNDSGSDLLGANGLTDKDTFEFFVADPNGHGATNTKVRRFSTVRRRFGAEMIWIDDSNLGSYFISYWPRKIHVTYGDGRSAGEAAIGITKNTSSADLSTSIESLADTTVLVGPVAAVVNSRFGYFSTSTAVKIGDILYPHTDGNPDNTASAQDGVVITRVS